MTNAMSALRVRPVDVGGSIAKGLQVRNAMTEMKERKRASEANQAFSQALSGGIPGDPAGRQALMGKAAAVSPQTAFDLDTYMGKMDTDKRARMVQEAEITYNALKDVQDPQSYAIAANSLRNYGIDVPPDYNPKQTSFVLQGARALLPREQFTLTPGQTRFDTQGQKIASVPVTPKLLSPEEEAQKVRIAQAGKTDISLGDQEKEEQKAFGKHLVANYAGIQERAAAAEDTLSQLAIARSIPVETGAAAPMKAAIGAYARALGFDPATLGLDQASGAQAFTGIMNNLVLTKMQAQKGPQTENDAARIEATLARLGNTPEANDFLFRSAEALEVRAVEQARFYRAFRERTGSFDGAATAWDAFKRDTPLVGTHPDTKQPVFFHEFETLVKRANRGATREEILKLWRSKYDG